MEWCFLFILHHHVRYLKKNTQAGYMDLDGNSNDASTNLKLETKGILLISSNCAFKNVVLLCAFTIRTTVTKDSLRTREATGLS